MPAYNAEKTLAKTYQRIPHKIVDEVIVVDDASSDKTAQVAKKLKLKLFVHRKNLGYGGNQKTCYREALKAKADIIIMLHPDYQYDPVYIPDMIKPLLENRYDIMLGSRVHSRQETLANGMPMYKYAGNRFLTFLENVVLGLNLSEYHTGYRAYRREALTKLPLAKFSDDFVFDQQILISASAAGLRLGEIFTPCLYLEESSSINFRRSVKYGLEIILNLARFMTNKKQFT